MALVDFQTAMGRMIRAGSGENPLRGLNLAAGERACLDTLSGSVGFRFTVEIQRSWCAGRATKSAHLTLSLLSDERRQCLLDQWTNSGAGVSSFHGAEADAFLDFIADRLPDPSHERTICRLEQAALRAGEGAGDFTAPDLSALAVPTQRLRRGRYAGMTRFYADPNRLLNAARGQETFPPVGEEMLTLLFGPGTDGLCRAAFPEEANLWALLAAPVAITTLQNAGYPQEMLAVFLTQGLAEYVL